MQVFSASRPELIHPFIGLRPAQFHRLVRLVARRGGDTIADGRPGRPWALTLPDRVLLVAVYWRTNLTMRQIGPLFGVSHSAAHRVIDTLGPLLAHAPVRRRPRGQVAIVDGTLIPTRDHRLAAQSKNYRYSANLQVAIDANTRLVTALGDPQPGNRNDTIVYHTSGISQQLAGRDEPSGQQGAENRDGPGDSHDDGERDGLGRQEDAPTAWDAPCTAHAARISAVRPAGVDVHTGVKGPDGRKQRELVEAFVAESRRGFAALDGGAAPHRG